MNEIKEGYVENVLPDVNEEFDVIVTSPPYNLAKDYGSVSDQWSEVGYLDWTSRIGHLLADSMKPWGSLFYNVGEKPSDQLKCLRIARVLSDRFEIQNVIHWVKSIAAPEEGVNIGHYKPVNSPRFINNCHEYIFHLTLTGNVELDRDAVGVPYKDKSNTERWSGGDVRCRGNTWFIPYETVSGKKPHPAAFPVKLPEMCIKLHGVENHTTVLDPFLGSGTTAVAAERLGCDWFGVEANGPFVDYARRRLEETKE